MSKFIVIFSHAIDVEADSKDEAVEKASAYWNNNEPPTAQDMNVEVETDI